MRSSVCDTVVRFCARSVLCRFAFPSAPALRSTDSAAVRTALFVGFPATMAESDFSPPYIIGYGLYGALVVKRASHHFFVLCYSILLFDPRREHSSAPTADFRHRRAQRRSRTALLSAAEGSSLTDASTAAGYPRSGGRPHNDPRGACHWPRAI